MLGTASSSLLSDSDSFDTGLTSLDETVREAVAPLAAPFFVPAEGFAEALPFIRAGGDLT